MDPISSATTVLQAIQTVGSLTLAIYQYVASVQDAESSRQALLNELIAIGGVLTAVKALVDGSLLHNDIPEGEQRIKALSKLWESNLLPCKATLDELLAWLTADANEKMKLRKKMLWPFKEKKINDAIGKLERYKTHLTLAISVESWNKLDHIRDLTFDIAEEQERTKYERKAQANEQKRQELLSWLQPISCSDKHSTSARQRQAKTCTWMFDIAGFKVWRMSKRAFLWLHGKPGSGKTILASAVIDELQADPHDAHALAYFYCDFRDARTTNGPVVLRSILTQLLRSAKGDWINKFPELVQRKSQGLGFPIDPDALCSLTLRASRLVDSPVVIIDALDECKDIEDLLPHLVRLVEEGDIRLFVTSRKEQAIVDSFRGQPCLSLNDTGEFVQEDMRTHIRKELSTRPKLSRLSPDLKEDISSILLAKADGMFRWVQCQLDAILACRTVKGIRDALGNLPRGLYETYDRILLGIEEKESEDSRIAQQSLVWLVGAVTPLTLSQLAEALKIEYDSPYLNDELGVINPSDILDVCGSLVDYNTATDIVVLSHYSVQEYLTLEHIRIQALLPYRISLPNAHVQLAILSITYILCEDLYTVAADDGGLQDDGDDDDDDDDDDAIPTHLNTMGPAVRRHPMLLYAVHHGLEHLGYINQEDENVFRCLEALQVKVFKDRGKSLDKILPSAAWYSVRRRWLDEGHHSPLWIPLCFGTPWMVNRVLRQNPDLLETEIGGDWGTPLVIAIWANRTDIADFLLDKGTDIDKPLRIISTVQSPLAWAAFYDLDELVDLFLRRGARLDPDILHSALSRIHDHNSVYVVRKLLEHGADVTVRVYGDTPLHVQLQGAIRGDDYCLEMVRVLVEGGCDVGAQNSKGRTALQIALNCRYSSIVEYLLSKGAQFADARHIYFDNVGWAADEPWYPALVEAAKTAQTYRTTSTYDVCKVKYILQTRLSLPGGVAKHILELAEYWACASTTCNNIQPRVPTEDAQDEPDLSVRVPGLSSACVRRIAFSWSYVRPEKAATDFGWFGAVLSHQDGTDSEQEMPWVTCPHIAEINLDVLNDVWDSRVPRAREVLEQLRPGDVLKFRAHRSAQVENDETDSTNLPRKLYRFFRVDLYHACW
ncbi:hypothetical protein BV22DRAFT_318170 [Leucogyrophana mollusca]|uniref:Uncharacterized protein n=1 Tax=Leucogyrophana mollusca TaxID=85980 RepID=A0ACB8BMS9_9AGAM|nr:hypothetical protein BV22DRAFT_318170 [Leucogyrophana mollusca]